MTLAEMSIVQVSQNRLFNRRQTAFVLRTRVGVDVYCVSYHFVPD